MISSESALIFGVLLIRKLVELRLNRRIASNQIQPVSHTMFYGGAMLLLTGISYLFSDVFKKKTLSPCLLKENERRLSMKSKNIGKAKNRSKFWIFKSINSCSRKCVNKLQEVVERFSKAKISDSSHIKDNIARSETRSHNEPSIASNEIETIIISDDDVERNEMNDIIEVLPRNTCTLLYDNYACATNPSTTSAFHSSSVSGSKQNFKSRVPKRRRKYSAHFNNDFKKTRSGRVYGHYC